MFAFAVMFLLLWLTLVVFLWFGTAWFQEYIYSEPAAQLYWRAPAAGAILTLWVGYWCFLDFRAPGRYPAPYNFSASETKKFDELWVMRDNKKVHYKLSNVSKGGLPGRPEFRETVFPYRTLSRSEAVIVKEDGEEVRFEAERDQNHNYKVPTGGELRYVDAKGRAMVESSLGQISTFRAGVFLTYAFLNLVFLGLWFVCLWLLARFQWSHALGLALVFWMGFVVMIVPMLLNKVEEAAYHRPPASQSLLPGRMAGHSLA